MNVMRKYVPRCPTCRKVMQSERLFACSAWCAKKENERIWLENSLKATEAGEWTREQYPDWSEADWMDACNPNEGSK